MTIRPILSMLPKTPPKTPRATIKRIAKILSDETRWTRDTMYRDENGNFLPHTLRDRAISCCLTGAVALVGGPYMDAIDQALRLAISNHHPHSEGGVTQTLFNDDPRTTHTTLMTVVKEAGEYLDATTV